MSGRLFRSNWLRGAGALTDTDVQLAGFYMIKAEGYKVLCGWLNGN
jgi:hypothetical protein